MSAHVSIAGELEKYAMVYGHVPNARVWGFIVVAMRYWTTFHKFRNFCQYTCKLNSDSLLNDTKCFLTCILFSAECEWKCPNF